MPEESETKNRGSFLGNREEDRAGRHRSGRGKTISRSRRETRGFGRGVRLASTGDAEKRYATSVRARSPAIIMLDSSPAALKQEAMLPGGSRCPGREEPG